MSKLVIMRGFITLLSISGYHCLPSSSLILYHSTTLLSCSRLIITFKLLEREHLATVLSLLNRGIFSQHTSRIDLIQKEGHDLRLVDVSVVRVDLDHRLDQAEDFIREALVVD